MIHDWYRVSIMCGYKLIHVRSVPSDLPVVSTTIKQTLNWTDYNLTGRKDMKVFGKRVFFALNPNRIYLKMKSNMPIKSYAKDSY